MVMRSRLLIAVALLTMFSGLSAVEGEGLKTLYVWYKGEFDKNGGIGQVEVTAKKLMLQIIGKNEWRAKEGEDGGLVPLGTAVWSKGKKKDPCGDGDFYRILKYNLAVAHVNQSVEAKWSGFVHRCGGDSGTPSTGLAHVAHIDADVDSRNQNHPTYAPDMSDEEDAVEDEGIGLVLLVNRGHDESAEGEKKGPEDFERDGARLNDADLLPIQVVLKGPEELRAKYTGAEGRVVLYQQTAGGYVSISEGESFDPRSGDPLVLEGISPGKVTLKFEVVGLDLGKTIDTLVVTVADVVLVTPDGDPVEAPVNQGDGQNQFTYDEAAKDYAHAKIELNCKATVTPGDPEVVEAVSRRLRFNCEKIGKEKFEWKNSPGSGEPAVDGDALTDVLTVKKMPEKNGDFGKKVAGLERIGESNAGRGYYTEQDIEVFYPQTTKTSPVAISKGKKGGLSWPNWFVYWAEGAVADYVADGTDYQCKKSKGGSNLKGLCVYKYSKPTKTEDGSITGLHIELYDPIVLQTNISFSRGNVDVSINTRPRVDSIESVAFVLGHEKVHEYVQRNWGDIKSDDWAATNDPDRDGIPTVQEQLMGTDPNNPASWPDYDYGGKVRELDQEVYCDWKASEYASYDAALDWSTHGKNWVSQ